MALQQTVDTLGALPEAEPWTLVQVDLHNAFNCLHRAAGLAVSSK